MIKFIKGKDIIETPFSLNNPVKSFLYQALIKRNFDPQWGWEGKEATSSQEKWVQEGFIFVYQDVRGKFKSEGEFVVMRPLRSNKSDPRATDESTDTYDTIE